ncbi:aldo/keto reductase (plasmid) [Streptomyces sp. SDT5-1]|uniref:aldo/keto reductase n=1 Tax=Streptomyces sp. SDT5-1 TaxID=3406418 RepID=UPI003FD18EE2
MTATLALGCYRLPPAALPHAARRAAASPAAWVDTAPNYRCGQRTLAPLLADLPRLRVGTKAGFLTTATARAAHAAGVVPSPHVRHCIAAPYVAWQLERNRAELGRERLDALFLHNPEQHQGLAELHAVLRESFAVLEEAVHAGHLACYGVAAWDGFADGAFSIERLDHLAAEAAGTREHHLRAVQLPVSLVMDHYLGQALRGRGPIPEAAARGWRVQASAPLHGGELTTMPLEDIAARLRPGATIASACLAAAASCPGVDNVLMSTANPAHWSDALAAVSEPVPAPVLQEVLDVLASPL